MSFTVLLPFTSPKLPRFIGGEAIKYVKISILTDLILISFRSNVNIHYAFTENLLMNHKRKHMRHRGKMNLHWRRMFLTRCFYTAMRLLVTSRSVVSSHLVSSQKEVSSQESSRGSSVILFIKYPLNCAENTKQTPTDFHWRFDEKKSLKQSDHWVQVSSGGFKEIIISPRQNASAKSLAPNCPRSAPMQRKSP